MLVTSVPVEERPSSPPVRRRATLDIKTIDATAPLTTLPTSAAFGDVDAAPTGRRAASPPPRRDDVHVAALRQAVEDDDESDEDDDDDDVVEGELHRMLTTQIGNVRSSSDDEIDGDGGGDGAERPARSAGASDVRDAAIGAGGDSIVDDSSSTTDGLDNSMSLTDLQPSTSTGPAKKRPSPPGNNSNDSNNNNMNINSSDDCDGDDLGSPLPQPPNHFLCPIQNTLLQDPVMDREGNTYEREAILRWLVLTSTNFDGGGPGDGDDDDDDEDTNNDGKTRSLGRGTSPITGNPMSVGELVEDKLVKKAIERWRKECWVRFLLSESRSNKELERSDEEEERRSDGRRGKKISIILNRKEGRGAHRIKMERRGSHGDGIIGASRKGDRGHKGESAPREEEAALPESARIISPSPSGELSQKSDASNRKAVARQYPPPPRPSSKQGRDRRPDGRGTNKGKPTPGGRTAATAAAPPAAASGPSDPVDGDHPPPRSRRAQSRDPSSPPPAAPVTSVAHGPGGNGASFRSDLTNPNDLLSLPASSSSRPRPRHNGWSAPLGVHKVACRAPGLRATTQVHRRSPPVRVPARASASYLKDLVIPPGSYVEILETQVHGERVRGRICWEREEEEDVPASSASKKGSIKRRTSRLLRRTASRRTLKKSSTEGRPPRLRTARYEGWISIQWAKDEEEKDAENGEDDEESAAGRSGSVLTATDEDAGPWTEPVPMGVYRINFGGGLPLRETPERDSAVLGKLDRGRCVEVVQTQVKGDRVRARVIVPDAPRDDREGSAGVEHASGWISLLNALTGSSGASPVPLGAYVAVAEEGCVITEGGRLDSRPRGSLVPGSCMEVVATRMEEGVVRGLIASGGHVTLFAPPGNRNDGRDPGGEKNAAANAGGKMFAMPVPLGTYQIIQNGLSVTTGISSSSAITMKLQPNATAEVVETRVEDGRVRGRVRSVANEDGSKVVGYERASSSGTGGAAAGWIHLFEPNRRWAKIVCFKGGRPVGGGGGGPASSRKCRGSQSGPIIKTSES